MQSIHASRAESRRGLLLILLAAILWGTVGISTKTIYTLAHTNPVSIGFFRLALALPVLFAVCCARQGRRVVHVSRNDFALMMVTGLMTALYQVCFFGAIERAGVAVSTLITLCSAPVLVAVISAVTTGKGPSRATLLSLFGALSGTALLVVSQHRNGTSGAAASGVFLALGSAFGYATVTLVSQKLAGRYDPFQSIALSFSMGAAILFGFAKTQGLVLNYPPLAWLLLVYLGTVPTALAYALFFSGMRSTSATVASTGTLLEPLVATLLAWTIFGESFTPIGFVGVSLLAGSLLMLYLKAAASALTIRKDHR